VKRHTLPVLLAASLTAGAAEAPAQDAPMSPTLVRFHEEMGGPRLLGLGGTSVGLGDDVSTARLNPAGLMTLPRSLDGIITGGGSDAGSQGLFAVAARPSRFFAAALRIGRTAREDLAPLAVDPRLPAIIPSASARFAGGAIAYRPLRRLAVGVALDRQSITVRPGLTTPPGASERPGSREKGWAFSAGVLFRADNPDAPRIGLAYRRRLDAEAEPLEDATGPAAAMFRLRTPSIFSAGLSWHYDFRNSRFLFAYQQDWVRYSELGRAIGLPRPHDDFDLRLGMEVSIPVFRECHTGCGSMLQVRGAIVSLAPVPFVAAAAQLSPFGQGPDRRTSWFLGGSIAPRRPWGGRLKLDGAYSRPTDSWLIGIAVRYPESHRGDLADVSSRRKR
jgi:hypothetical protein